MIKLWKRYVLYIRYVTAMHLGAFPAVLCFYTSLFLHFICDCDAVLITSEKIKQKICFFFVILFLIFWYMCKLL